MFKIQKTYNENKEHAQNSNASDINAVRQLSPTKDNILDDIYAVKYASTE